MAHPPVDASAGFEPFSLPQISQSLTDWCAFTTMRFWHDHQRALALLLLLDLPSRQWAAAIPAQHCSKHASCWSAAKADFPQFPPNSVLAGSYQSRILCSGEEPSDCPPPHDGLHFVQMLDSHSQAQVIWSFIRAQNQTRSVDGSSVILDDWAAAIDQAMPRLTLL
jgi:hypothetical protein